MHVICKEILNIESEIFFFFLKKKICHLIVKPIFLLGLSIVCLQKWLMVSKEEKKVYFWVLRVELYNHEDPIVIKSLFLC